MFITLCVIGGLVVLPIVYGLATKKQVNIEDKIIINKPVEVVFEYIRHIKNQDEFSVWNRMDPDMKKEYRGTDGQVGFIYSWDSSKNKNVGAGEQEITAIVPNQSIEMELRFKRPMEDIAKARMTTTSHGPNQTEVMWGFYNRMKFPMTIMKPIFMSMLKKSLTGGLHSLKAVLERGSH